MNIPNGRRKNRLPMDVVRANMGRHISIDETAFASGNPYAIVTKKEVKTEKDQ